MSTFRPECVNADQKSIPDDTALFLIKDSVARRKELIYGRLHDGYGQHCAIGAFWKDNPKAVLNSSLIDEVAAVNDSVPPSATARERWQKVNSWLRFKIASLTNKKAKQ
jgi:hypothetical protein